MAPLTVETVNYPELMIHKVSDRAQGLPYFPAILKIFPSVAVRSLLHPRCLSAYSGNHQIIDRLPCKVIQRLIEP